MKNLVNLRCRRGKGRVSAKLIKLRTIIDFFLLNSNLTKETLIKKINELIRIHNEQVKQGKLSEDIMEQITTTKQLLCLTDTKKRAYEFFEDTEYEGIMKARYRERGNYVYVAYEMNMSQGKYYYMMNKVYDFFVKELYRNGLIRCRYDDVNLKIVSAFFGCIKKISIEERGYIRSYSKFEFFIQENFLVAKIEEAKINLYFNY